MSEETLNVVNDTHEPNVEVQEPVVDNQVVESVQEPIADSEVTTEQPEDKKPQTREENANAAKIRKEAEAKATDKAYEDMFKNKPELNIHSKADYDKAYQKQRELELAEKVKKGEVDPETVINEFKTEWEKNDPRIKEYERIKKDEAARVHLETLNNELSELGLDTVKSLEDIVNLKNYEKISSYVKKGNSLAESYFLANKNEIITQKATKTKNETIKHIQANDASPGSLADNGETPTLFTKEQYDSMSQAEVNANYDLLMKSMKKW